MYFSLYVNQDQYYMATRNSHHFSGYRVLCGVPEHRVRAAEKEIEYDFHILVDAL